MLLPLLSGVLLLFFPAQKAASAATRANPLPAADGQEWLPPEKLVFLLQYIGTDYAAAVRSGQVIDPAEYREMRDFAQTLLEHYEKGCSPGPADELASELRQLEQLIEERIEPAEVRHLTQQLAPRLIQRLNVMSYPRAAPDLARGQELYSQNCAKCHGPEGDGRGASAPEQDPAPTSFQEERMNDLPPYQIYNAVSFGVDGTDMPSHQDSLNDQDRWNLAFYVMTLRKDFDPKAPGRLPPVSLRSLATRSNRQLLAEAGEGSVLSLSQIDYQRQNPPPFASQDLIGLAQLKLDQSLNAYRQGRAGPAVSLTLEAYLEAIEPLEIRLRQKDWTLTRELEQRFARYRASLKAGVPVESAAAQVQELKRITQRAQETLQQSDVAWGFALTQSLTIILREGVEAALLVGLIFTYLAAAGYHRLQRYVVLGAGLGILAGLLTWALAQRILEISPLQQEALEAITSLLAAAVLFTVSFWIIHHADTRHWKSYIRSKAEQALGTGSGIALASAAFLAVYREAFETVLFYQALWLRSTTQTAVLLGLAMGAAALLVLIALMFRFGLRIPIKQFFAVTGVLLGLLSFMFAGYGVRELQTIGWVKETPLLWMIRFPLLEIEPTLEGCALQFGILLSFLLLVTQTQLVSRHRIS